MFFTRSVATLLVSLGLSTACQSAQAEVLEQWVLEQNYEGKGDVRVVIAANAVAVYNKQSNYKAVVKAPDYKVHVFRSDRKTEWTGPLKRFNGKMLSDPIGSDSTGTNIIKPGSTGQIKGLKYLRYFDPNSKHEILGAADIVTTPQVSEFLCRYFDCPVLNKVPLSFTFDKTAATLAKPKTVWLDINVLRSTRSGRITKLSTTNWKKSPYQQNEFALPQNYKQISALTDITFSPGQQEAFTEALDGLGFTTDIDKLRKK
ncbi:MAG: hypothetical protein IPP97_23645 [Candidatus Obscuribacter sp.]|nr:hypothetical protein [Candidatus Obscuribacter sp.]